MSELKRPASIRELLDALPRPTIVYLCEVRGLPVSRSNDDCRSSVARSFRGQRDEFLSLLRKDELVLLLRRGIRDGDASFHLPSPEAFVKRELLELATRGFGRLGELARPFVLRGGTSSAAQAPLSLTETDDTAVAEPEGSPLSAGTDAAGWSRPRAVRALLAQVGMVAPSELTQEVFGELVESLETRGYEVASSSGARLTPLHDAVGIDAELRLRHDAFAAPSASWKLGLHDARPTASADPVEMSPYARAGLRLALLTARSATQDAGLDWIDACVDAAAAGLNLDSAARDLLRRVATALAETSRHPITALNGLVGRLEHEDGEVLVRDYVAIHRADHVLSALLAEHWSALRAARPV